jgi:signal transduction histidine kinase
MWFKIVVTLAAAALLWMLYILRLRRATAELSGRLGERLQERERIARELHDTLLQDFQAVILRFQLVANRLVKGDSPREEIHAQIEQGLEYGDKVLAEGREHIRDIRADTKAFDGLVESLALYGQELSHLWPIKFAITTTGKPFELYPVVRDEMYRIGREALGNAFRHSNGSEVTVEVSYTADAFIMRICDDGQGIGADILKEGRPGHWGINNMRERARIIGASINFSSLADSGTCLELKIAVELANGSGAPWFKLKRKSGVRDQTIHE